MKSFGIFCTRIVGAASLLVGAVIPLGVQWLYCHGPDWTQLKSGHSENEPAAGLCLTAALTVFLFIVFGCWMFVIASNASPEDDKQPPPAGR